jgi:hypothetical protein
MEKPATFGCGPHPFHISSSWLSSSRSRSSGPILEGVSLFSGLSPHTRNSKLHTKPNHTRTLVNKEIPHFVMLISTDIYVFTNLQSLRSIQSRLPFEDFHCQYQRRISFPSCALGTQRQHYFPEESQGGLGYWARVFLREQMYRN